MKRSEPVIRGVTLAVGDRDLAARRDDRVPELFVFSTVRLSFRGSFFSILAPFDVQYFLIASPPRARGGIFYRRGCP